MLPPIKQQGGEAKQADGNVYDLWPLIFSPLGSYSRFLLPGNESGLQICPLFHLCVWYCPAIQNRITTVIKPYSEKQQQQQKA